LWKDFKDVGRLPISETAIRIGIDAGFLAQLAQRRLDQRFARLLATGHRLPVAGIVSALDEQHAQVGGMNQHQRRNRNLVRHGNDVGVGGDAASVRRPTDQSTNTQNGLCRSRQ
jgi:hypothetical protein